MAQISDLSVGDAVSWSIPKPPQEDSIAHGIIKSLNSEDETATIRVWAILENGDHEETDRDVEIEVGRLRKISNFTNEEDKQVSARVERVLRDKVEEHNADNPRYRATFRMLEAVFRRGIGAYRTNPASVRGNVRSADQWAYARVNAFLRALRTGKFPRSAFDTDLLPSNHPLSSKSYEGKEVGTVPQFIRENARRGLENLEFAGSGLTDKTKREAREMANGEISENKAIRMNAWFLRHISDLDSARANEYLRGETDRMTAGQVAWLLWGGDLGKSNRMRAQKWAERQVNRIRNEKNFESAIELIRRKKMLRDGEWEVRLNRFRTKQSRSRVYEEYDKLLGDWDFELARQYYGLLDAQRKSVNKVLAENPPTIAGIELLVNNAIDNTTNQWKEDLVPVYESMTLDFAFLQTNFLLPDEKDNAVFTPSEQERITRARRRRPRKEIIEEGLYPRRRGGARLPINRQSFNKESSKFIQNRLDTFLPDMSKTAKTNLNRALRKSFDEATELGLTGRKFENYMRKEISKVIGKKNLGRAMNIARTEGSALSNFAMNESATATGLSLSKEWLTQRDGRVRDSHLFADGLEVGMNEAFVISGYKLRYPADSGLGAPAGLVCNCRCTLIYHEKRI
tara:strand:+ start:509 stop:2389 length:1881 start_codon:yes stop_codon:yes gene_type:complete